jgi:uncharacterized membrane protein
MKKLYIAILSAIIPFILVWAGFILTAFSYDPREVFKGGTFWGVSCIYWLLWICMIAMILDMIDEDIANNKKNTHD